MSEKNEEIIKEIDKDINHTADDTTTKEPLVEEDVKDLSEEELLQNKILALTNEIEVKNNENLKIRAEFDNFRKRNNKERERTHHMATIAIVEKILPVIDNFDRAMDSNCNDTGFKDGINLILNQFIEVLNSIGIEEIDALGKPFNPNYHNAVLHEKNDDVDENTVVEILQKGYKLGDIVLRHAMVKVAN